MNGANAPPAPSDAPLPLPRANWALPSDCFSNATASTRLVLAGLDVRRGDDRRWCRRPSRRCAPGTSACPPRRARRTGRARASSRPRTGRAPCRGRRRRCRPSSCGRPRGRGTRPRGRGRRTRRRARRDLWWVWPTPTTRRCGAHAPSLQDADEVLLQARARLVEWASARLPPPKTWSAA